MQSSVSRKAIAPGTPRRAPVNRLTSASGQANNRGLAMKGRGRLRPGTLAALILSGGLLAGTAGAQPPELGVSSIGILPPPDILESVSYLGLYPTGEPVRRGPYYVLHAYDRAGIELRVVVDAQFGDVLFMAPALNTSLTPPYTRAARIIQVAPESG